MMKRIFVAINISEATRIKGNDLIAGLRKEFSNLRVSWEKAEKLHLTLKFLGDVDEKKLDVLTKAVENVANQIEKFTIQIAETGQFGKRVLWLGVKDGAWNLLKIHDLLENECEKIGFARETKKFNPHLTIARLRETNKSSNLVKKHLQNNFEGDEFEVSEIVIYESQILPTGSKYKKWKSVNVKG